MPDFDGLELCRRIRGSDRHCTIKLINMTSRYDESVAERALAAGADRCLPKPVSPADLMRIFDGPGDEHRASSSSRS
jgi:CheY-like chemotaxis protein